MPRAGVAPNVVTYTTLMKGAANAGDLELCQELLLSLEAAGRRACSSTSRSGSGGGGRGGDGGGKVAGGGGGGERGEGRGGAAAATTSAAATAAEASARKAAMPNLRTFNTFCRCCVRAGAIDPAVDTVARMQDEWSVAADSSTYESVVALLCQGLRLREAGAIVVGLRKASSSFSPSSSSPPPPPPLTSSSSSSSLSSADDPAGNPALYIALARASLLLGDASRAKKALRWCRGALESYESRRARAQREMLAKGMGIQAGSAPGGGQCCAKERGEGRGGRERGGEEEEEMRDG